MIHIPVMPALNKNTPMTISSTDIEDNLHTC